jgi:hypothetical protein
MNQNRHISTTEGEITQHLVNVNTPISMNQNRQDSTTQGEITQNLGTMTYLPCTMEWIGILTGLNIGILIWWTTWTWRLIQTSIWPSWWIHIVILNRIGHSYTTSTCRQSTDWKSYWFLPPCKNCLLLVVNKFFSKYSTRINLNLSWIAMQIRPL